MSTFLAHSGHSHGPDWGLITLLAVGLLLGAWAVATALRGRRRIHNQTPPGKR